ncbi:sialate O-acetylesterase-like isoform X2 [Apostichopus japonicus]|uniref:sialate O-acetylesterase-like isoform X2 n=1 Tax=Stichopus japonicus TaxID=307972 RepID=UPI003AB423BC
MSLRYSQDLIYAVIALCMSSAYICDGASTGNLSLASYYSDHMVLQMGPKSAIIWGYANAGQKIAVTFKEKLYKAVATPDTFYSSAVWKVALDPTPPSGPFNITITTVTDHMSEGEEILLQDVLFGDIWLCSGQSNMAFPVPAVFNASQVLNDSYNHPNIRLLAVNEVSSTTPYYDLSSLYEPWSLPSPKSLGGNGSQGFLYFSAVCYLFGVELQQHLRYPIGLVSDNWGGSYIQAWSSSDVLKSCPSQMDEKPKKVVNISKPMNIWEKMEVEGPSGDSILWNAMIHPMLNFTIKGVLWYQGEANSAESDRYACLFPAMINDWRRKWYEGTGGNTEVAFPFGFVQLCTSNVPFNDTDYPLIRRAQTAGYGYVPNPKMENVFMSVSLDLPDPSSPYDAIHPRDKQDVAHRLVLGARAIGYNEAYTEFQGPYPRRVCGITNNKIVVDYQFSDVKLISGKLFEVCCYDEVTCDLEPDAWKTADVVYQVNSTSVMLGYQCDKTYSATYLRYLWKDMPCEFKNCAVYGAKNDLPGPPFLLPVQSCE